MFRRYITLAAIAVLAIIVGLPGDALSGVSQCDPHRSRLCRGITAFYDLDEVTDSIRRDELSDGILLEEDGIDATLGTSSPSAQLGSGYVKDGSFRTPYASLGGGGNWTICVWAYPISAGQGSARVLILAEDDHSMGTEVRLTTGNKLRLYVQSSDGDSQQYVDSAGSVTANTWNLLCFARNTENLLQGEQVMVSVNAAVFTKKSITTDWSWKSPVRAYPTGSDGLSLSTYSGKVYFDGLAFWNRKLHQNDMLEYYNSGSGKEFPFY